MSERSLAHIEKVLDVVPIENADAIELAKILGWQVVVRKGTVAKDDTVVFCEVDSILPTIKYFDFMTERKYRLRSIKLRKTLSQGLIIPIADIPVISQQLKELDSNRKIDFKKCWEMGEDLTELLGIKKYLTPSEREELNEVCNKKKHNWFTKFMTRFEWYRKMFKKKSKSFPEWISKTDEERCISEGTLINTDKGFVTIDMVVKDINKYKVFSYNESTKVNEFKEIIAFNVKRNNNDWLEIKTKSGKNIVVTENHRIYMQELDCYRMAKDIKEGDKVKINR